MRILTAIYGPDRGGSERALLRLMREISRNGHDVEIIGETGDGSARPFRLARTIRRRARLARPDILFAPGQTYALPFALAALGGGTDAPLVTKISNMPDGSPSRHWLSLQRRWTTAFVAPDGASAARLTRDIGAEVTAIDNPCADRQRLLALHARAHPPRDGLHLLAIGRLVPQKHFASLIRAFAREGSPADSLTILGDGPEGPRLAREAARVPAANIVLAGHVDDPAPCFARATAFASSSLFEGLPAVLIEALAAGLPIAATDSSPAVRALFEDGKLGILVPARDDGALAAALARLRGFRPDLDAMLAAALRFTAEAAAPAYITLFQTLARRAKTGE